MDLNRLEVGVEALGRLACELDYSGFADSVFLHVSSSFPHSKTSQYVSQDLA